MLGRYNRLLIVLLIVAAALYVMILNREPVVVHFSSESNVETTTGVMFIVLFSLGILTASSVALLFGMRFAWRERRFESRERNRQQFFQDIANARGLLAAGDWQASRLMWEQAIKRDPSGVMARVELSKCLQGAGDSTEALRVLDEARALDPSNLEVLFRAAELHLASGNRTAAVDNLALVLRKHPSQRAATMARDLCEELERLDEALEYQSKLDSLGYYDSEATNRLTFRKICLQYSKEPEQLEAELRSFYKRHTEFSPAVERLASLLASQGKTPEAVDLLVKAGKSSGKASMWFEAAKLWMKQEMPEKAVSLARAATNATQGRERLEAELNLIRTFVLLNMFEEAKSAIDGFEKLAQGTGVEPRPEMWQQFYALKGLCLNRLGAFAEAAQIWAKLAAQEGQTAAKPAPQNGIRLDAGYAPSPSLSTP
jgi:tetratricopeptide (TPR) repeat protein